MVSGPAASEYTVHFEIKGRPVFIAPGLKKATIFYVCFRTAAVVQAGGDVDLKRDCTL